ncbi:MAG: tetratricopeptide repeat protein [Muribaculaceae bacterium]|nr:tetratricopeptide repeat protein [Muribaculaceae bacterium]
MKNRLTITSNRERNSRHYFRRVITMLLGVMCAFVTMIGQISADRVMNIGRNALYFEDYVVAIQYFNQAISTKPYLAKPYFYRAIAKLNLEDYRGAEEDATRAIELNEFITDAWEVRGVARQNMGDNSGAITDYEHALALVPRNRQLMFNLAVACSEDNRIEQADSLFSEVIKHYPGFENAYLGRARMRLEQADTLHALEDIDTALVRNPKSFNGHVMRAELLMHRSKPLFRSALESMDKAIRLEPKIAGLYINRAYIRYNLDDWDGAMEDYDYALSLEPYNKTALFNRGMLSAQANANDRAFDDFSAVIALNPSDHLAHYNRAMVRARKNDYSGAIEDINAVIAVYPGFPAAYLIRSDFERALGNMNKAKADYDKGMQLTAALRPVDGKVDIDDHTPLDSIGITERDFEQLLTIHDNTDLRQEYNNTAIRGRIQDRNLDIQPEPMIELAYYTSPDEVSENTFYIKELDDLNKTRQLRFVVFATINPPRLVDENAVRQHFNSIEYYNSYLSSHSPRAVDYLGRAMDFITLRDYASAIRDIDRAIALNADYAPSYLLRAQARWRLNKAEKSADSDVSDSKTRDALTRQTLERQTFDEILSDLQKAIDLSPTSPLPYYNKAVALIEYGDMEGALEYLNKAIQLAPDFGQAYYNRGYVLLSNGKRGEGIEDLSKAGQLGIVQAYNLIKRISR